jgi:hypothetical protein
VIYQGSLFYHSYNTDVLMRYDLHLKRVVAEVSLKLSKNETTEQFCRVYSDHREHVGCFDFNVDENGVWVIYRNGSRSNIYVSKLNVDDLMLQKTVVIKFDATAATNRMRKRDEYLLHHRQQLTDNGDMTNMGGGGLSGTGGSKPQQPQKQKIDPYMQNRNLDDILNGFIICGKIYFLQYHGSQNTIIRLMFDLYNLNTKFSYLQSIEFIQPYKKNTQLTYNPYDQKLYAWDSEHLITYSLELV